MIKSILNFFLALKDSRTTVIDAYLADSTDMADLERRQKYLRNLGYL